MATEMINSDSTGFIIMSLVMSGGERWSPLKDWMISGSRSNLWLYETLISKRNCGQKFFCIYDEPGNCGKTNKPVAPRKE